MKIKWPTIDDPTGGRNETVTLKCEHCDYQEKGIVYSNADMWHLFEITLHLRKCKKCGKKGTL